LYRPFLPEKLWVEKRVATLPTTGEILARLPGVPIEWIETVHQALAERQESSAARILLLAQQDGEFLKPCPGTQKYVCCNYYFFNLATNCDIGCSYCILQGYLNNPYLTVYTNLEAGLAELAQRLRSAPQRFFRIGTGELTDSLTLDHLTGYSKKLIPFFLEQSNAILELKTKTTQIDNLLQFSPRRQVIVSWSLNPERLIEREESQAPSLRLRLEAASACAAAGYLIGFHFDPLIYYPDWEQDYQAVVRELFRAVPAEQIVWISLGALRYPAAMDRIVRERHPESEIVLDEMLPGKDGKLRYFRPLRQQLFHRMIAWIRAESKQVQIYLCMESREVWRQAFGRQLLSRCSLPRQLDRAVKVSRKA